jgi:hypothetical protein
MLLCLCCSPKQGGAIDPMTEDLWGQLPAWLPKHPPTEVPEAVKPAIDAVHSKHSSVQYMGKLTAQHW